MDSITGWCTQLPSSLCRRLRWLFSLWTSTIWRDSGGQAEKERLQNELMFAKAEVNHYKDEIQKLQHELKFAKDQAVQYENEAQQKTQLLRLAEDDKKMLTSEVSQFSDRLRQSETASITNRQREGKVVKSQPSQIELRLAQENKQLKQQQSKQEQEMLKSKQELQAVEGQLVYARKREEALMKERDSMQALLDARRKELSDAQVYLTSVDSVSESDVAGMITKLNAEISQAVTWMVEALDTQPTEIPSDDTIQQLKMLLGDSFIRHLSTFYSRDGEDDTFLLEIVLQAAILFFVGTVISSWGLSGGQADPLLVAVYDRMRSTEDQRVVGRWRALTRKYVQPNGEHARMQLAHLPIILYNIFLVARRGGLSQEDLAQNLNDIVEATLELRRVIGEGIVGSDYSVVLGQPDQPFDPDKMIDAHNVKGQTPSNGRVLCIAELGLERMEGGVQGASTTQRNLLVKPKVVLDDVLHELGLDSYGDRDVLTSAGSTPPGQMNPPGRAYH
ncbi:uncharacterized protein FIBRA_03073 [Fibroporia radiculosa]|uniref:Uncharacterized protein n=1 Tax=Fibroporia radiculosa TaxID=599839 RepID=J4GNA0_9APHY|nr:uncharacterized protein FIBRA_03073 [Fibroporia radiculosa]CCM01025.1 predicted protein [Fibroporia radiculosa]